ncbi:T9SS type A sorting domain-containing protein [Yeosuana sp. MJ-SS3]|uniref:T9SS type A sorting domain-containing protein n=1 Tax=Gilvirhabdus luticola TaxID=3079858 RepID=A0ABU3U3N9_9FLAO|nr:T9SS type A sorting domain-containing protein [Yeosuana sp. MJ-SS3]MDU8884961.1 T9SS type A sorting domain-containing protein [Yeosuana sp. MJ-SS3]
MKKNYIFLLLFVLLFLVSNQSHGQSGFQNNDSNNIEGLTIYPNPVSHGKLYITTKQNLNKEVEIFNVLGKSIYKTTLFSKELNVSKLHSGVYLLKITENNISTTRKLVIK